MHDDLDVGDGFTDTLTGFIVMTTGIFLLVVTLLILFVGFLSALFLLDHLFLGNIIHWGLEVVWGLMILLYWRLFFKFSTPNPTDWIPIKLGHKIQWNFNATISTSPAANGDAQAIDLDKEITKWLKENVSLFMYARGNYDTYYFLRRSDYIAFKLRWT